TEELKRYYPSDVLVTGFDIIFFWVARMMMMGLHFMNDVPFHTIYIHALVRDEKGQKMSKSKGNVLDPLDLIEKYGTDALRFTLTSMAAQGRDLKLSESRIEGYRNFATKLWNASRYTQIKQCRYEATFNPNQCNLAVNKWIIFEVTKAVESVQKSIENYRFNDAAKFIYQFSWATFCDWYIEFTKPILAGENAEEINETKATTMWVLKQILNTLNPIMPYLSEELWENLGYEGLLINQDWPSLGSINLDLQAAKEIEWIVHIITAIRSIRAEGSVPHKVKAQLILKDLSDEQRGQIDRNYSILSKLTNINNILFTSETMPKGSIQSLLDEISIGLIIVDEIDVSKEKERIRRDLKKTLEDIEKISKKISNEQFIKNAPEKVILENKQRLTDAMYKRSKLEDAKARLKV
ncbi:MAG: class I tRNA ligase family protein, partial [Rhodospirillaceae bacterium]|nr:class I tRNA ligase family protein [Rhodospirillaceae bacterium]